MHISGAPANLCTSQHSSSERQAVGDRPLGSVLEKGATAAASWRHLPRSDQAHRYLLGEGTAAAGA